MHARAQARSAGTQVFAGDPAVADRRLAQLAALAADLQRAARRSPGFRAPSSGSLREGGRQIEATPETFAIAAFAAATLFVPAAALAPAITAVPDAPAPAWSPVPVVRTLANGLRVAVLTDTRAPIVQMQLLVPAGVVAEPIRCPASPLTAMLVDDGTSSRTAGSVASELAAMGATFSAERPRARLRFGRLRRRARMRSNKPPNS